SKFPVSSRSAQPSTLLVIRSSCIRDVELLTLRAVHRRAHRASKTIERVPVVGSAGHSKGTVMKTLTRFWSDQSGATAIEYGLLAALISVVIIGAVKTVGTNMSTKFTQIANNLS